MTYQIRWTRRALQRLDEIAGYIAKDNAGAAGRVVARLISLTERLASTPEMGRSGRVKGTRELVVAGLPYIIAYRIAGTNIDILTILRSSQRWPSGLR
jgi:toxin ParE1/3/4